MPETATLRQTAEAWESLFRCQVTIMRRLQRHPVFKQLNMREYDVLFTLSSCPQEGIRFSGLNENLLMSQPSLSRMVDRLEAKGLIRRCTDPSDQRAVLLSLTPEGAELQREIGRVHVRHIQELLGPALSAGELEQLAALTRKLGTAVAAQDR
jgi:DNA-binding MarR family transcriptional regulator